ncbi:hypothetical protein [uncultured Paludibaculum sp.]|uniref:hypothetical protein n=1 Tax=uncultured Paludibaculum sp. TaxID=1765020 RepID=UPI002AAC2CA1|nr:hypothetical protein [uncultured Paludibaculum sp.]
MALPQQVRVKLSSEAAEYVSLTPVVVQTLPFAELMHHVASAAGPDPVRVREILKRGTLVSGASRFRWEGWLCEEADAEAAVALLPKPEPGRRLDPICCLKATLASSTSRVDISREAAMPRRFLRRRSYWQCLLEASGEARYLTYSYRDRADHYRVDLVAEACERLRNDSALLKFDGLAKQIRMREFDHIHWVVGREAPAR